MKKKTTTERFNQRQLKLRTDKVLIRAFTEAVRNLEDGIFEWKNLKWWITPK